MKFVVLLLLLALTLEGRAQTWLRADKTRDTYSLINSVFGQWGASEVPDCGHNVRHIEMGYDGTLQRDVFFFKAHARQDDDRCLKFDRQRTEIRPDQIGDLTGRDGDYVSYSWNFRLDAGFVPSNAYFIHLHQLKAVGGDDSLPLVTVSAHGKNPDRIIIGHTNSNGVNANLGSADLNLFKGVWVHCQEEVHYGRSGSYRITITRISDGQVLLHTERPNIELWRSGSVQYIRPKWGIYRSLSDQAALRDEDVRFDSFCCGRNGGHCP